MPVQYQVKPAEGKVSKVRKGANGTETSEVAEKVTEVVAQNPTANVGFSASYTKNLGNYESLKLNVSLNLPVDLPDDLNVGDRDDRLSTAFLFVQDWVEERLRYALNEALKNDAEDKV